jgi:phage terminase large subunit
MPLWAYLENGGKHAVAVWHRRAGKDEIALHRAAVAAFERPATYWHMLPQYAQARKAIWDAVNPHSGLRRIDEAFPREICESRNEQEMKIRFKSGSVWQVVGSDNFNSLVGSPPAGVTFSEWSLANPMSYAYLSPILAENNGWACFIYTARGYNHGHATYQSARRDHTAFAELLTADDTGVIPPEVLVRQKAAYVDLYGPEAGESVFRQEFYNDWSASNIGAVLGSALERAEREGRIGELEDDEWPVVVSSDIGFRDTAAFWVWRPRKSGFDLIEYDSSIQLDADDWVERLQAKGYAYSAIYLPHDARAKTFQSKHSVLERFIEGFGAQIVRIVPQAKISDRINAARRVIERCRFDAHTCDAGLSGLRSWAYAYDEEKKIYSREPRHDWASHPGDAFSYGAQVLETRPELPGPPPARKGVQVDADSGMTLNEMWASVPRATHRI